MAEHLAEEAGGSSTNGTNGTAGNATAGNVSNPWVQAVDEHAEATAEASAVAAAAEDAHTAAKQEFREARVDHYCEKANETNSTKYKKKCDKAEKSLAGGNASNASAL